MYSRDAAPKRCCHVATVRLDIDMYPLRLHYRKSPGKFSRGFCVLPCVRVSRTRGRTGFEHTPRCPAA